MPFNIFAFPGFLVLVLAWALCSWATYRFLAQVDLEKRDWLDSSLTRRTAWVLSGPLFWIMAVWVVVIYTIYVMFKDLAKLVIRRWKRKQQNPSVRTRARRARWDRFVSNV